MYKDIRSHKDNINRKTEEGAFLFQGTLHGKLEELRLIDMFVTNLG